MLNTKNLKRAIIFALIGGTIAAVGAAAVYARNAADAERQRDIAEANLEAARDTITRYGDSISTTVSLMQEQGQLSQDSILLLNATLAAAIYERNLNIESLQDLRLEFARLEGRYASARVRIREDSIAHGEDELAEGEEEASFRLDGPPIEGTLFVTRRTHPEPWGLQTNIGVTPFSMTYSVGCQERVPVVNVTTPDWVTVTPERGTVSEDVCNPVLPNTGWGGIFRVDIANSVWGVAGGVLGFLIGKWIYDDDYVYSECFDGFCYGGGGVSRED